MSAATLLGGLDHRRALRLGAAVLVVSAALFLVAANTSLGGDTAADFSTFREQAELSPAERTPLAPPRDGVTVVTAHARGDLFALAPDGTLLYHNGSRDGYFDVDPSPRGDRTVLYAAVDELDADETGCVPVESQCVRQVVERVNLTTGETTRLYETVGPRFENSEWHDVDRLDRHRIVVADTARDRILVVNTTSGLTEWTWHVQRAYPLTSGGSYPDDWSHLNDVEVLPDGRIMASLRNQDTVVFVDPETGLDPDWTLGSEGDHEIMYKQHNPDFVPAERGGPSVVVADSVNNRLVEFQREGGGWTKTWEWRDEQMRWPRDADRLPNGNTLVTDTHGGRVMEVAPNGSVVWTLSLPRAYEAERLGTGDESAGGESARAAGLASRTLGEGDATATARARSGFLNLFPSRWVSAVQNTVPPWVGLADLLAGLVLVGAVTGWLGLELRWTLARYRLRSPVTRRD